MDNETKDSYIDNICIEANSDVPLLNLNASKKQLTELVTECPKIIFRYSDKHCWSCVERVLNACSNYKNNPVASPLFTC